MVTPPGLSGPDALRAYFAPRQVLRLKEAALCLNYSYSHFFRRIQSGTLDLKIRKNEVGERFVLLDDLIAYIFPPSETAPSSPPVDLWHERIGEPTLADAILDRLVHNAYTITLKGDSMRKRLKA